MNPEDVPKPDLSRERAEQLGKDGLQLKQQLERRRAWLIREQQNTPSSDRRALIDEEISKIAQILENLRANEQDFKEDAAIQFLHDAARILVDTRYAGTADILPFEQRKK